MKLNARQQRAIDLLRADPRRYLYQTCNYFDYCITDTADEKYEYLVKGDVDVLVGLGLIVPTWPDANDVQCWRLK